MAVLYITEFAATSADHARGGAAAYQPPVAEQTVAIGGASAPSNAFNKNTNLVRLHTDAICAIEFGTNPTAVAAGGGSPTARMAANQTEYFAVPNTGTFKVAVISST